MTAITKSKQKGGDPNGRLHGPAEATADLVLLDLETTKTSSKSQGSVQCAAKSSSTKVYPQCVCVVV